MPPLKRILVRLPNWLGDAVMATGFLAALRTKEPFAQIDLIVKKGLEALPYPVNGKIIPFDKKSMSLWRFGRALREERYDEFYVLPPSFSAAFMAFLSGAKRRVGQDYLGRGFLLTDVVPFGKPPRSRHLLREYLELLRPSGDSPANEASILRPRFQIDSAWVDGHWPAKLQISSPYVVFAPGGIYGPAKRWPAEKYQALASRFAGEGTAVLLVGTPDDIQMADEIKNGREEISNLCGKTSLVELIAILSRAQGLISNDSGAMHVMAAVGGVQVAIFGSTAPAWTGPLNPKARVVTLALSCSPCFKRVCPLGHTNCLREIDEKRVWEEFKQAS